MRRRRSGIAPTLRESSRPKSSWVASLCRVIAAPPPVRPAGNCEAMLAQAVRLFRGGSTVVKAPQIFDPQFVKASSNRHTAEQESKPHPKEATMTDMALQGSLEPALPSATRPNLDKGFNPLTMILFFGALAGGLL